MRQWRARRASGYTPGVQAHLDNLGIGTDAQWLWDNAIHQIEETLCGAERERLDAVYPPNRDGVRLALTDRTRGLPPVRIAFYLDEDDEDRVMYVAVALRAD